MVNAAYRLREQLTRAIEEMAAEVNPATNPRFSAALINKRRGSQVAIAVLMRTALASRFRGCRLIVSSTQVRLLPTAGIYRGWPQVQAPVPPHLGWVIMADQETAVELGKVVTITDAENPLAQMMLDNAPIIEQAIATYGVSHVAEFFVHAGTGIAALYAAEIGVTGDTGDDQEGEPA